MYKDLALWCQTHLLVGKTAVKNGVSVSIGAGVITGSKRDLSFPSEREFILC